MKAEVQSEAPRNPGNSLPYWPSGLINRFQSAFVDAYRALKQLSARALKWLKSEGETLVYLTAISMIVSLIVYVNVPRSKPHFTPEQRDAFMRAMQGHDLSNVAFAGPTVDYLTLWSNATFHVRGNSYEVEFTGIRPLWTDPRVMSIAIDNTLTFSPMGKLYRSRLNVHPVENNLLPHQAAAIFYWGSWHVFSLYTWLTGDIRLQEFTFQYPMLTILLIVLAVSLFQGFTSPNYEQN